MSSERDNDDVRWTRDDILKRPVGDSIWVEERIVGGVLLMPRQIDEIAQLVEPGHFHDDRLRCLFCHIVALHNDDRRCDGCELMVSLRESGDDKLIGIRRLGKLIARVQAAQLAIEYATLLREWRRPSL
jgi:replicative DNA helicase